MITCQDLKHSQSLAIALGAEFDSANVVNEAVLTNGGEVVLVADGTLAQHQRIALVLRY